MLFDNIIIFFWYIFVIVIIIIIIITWDGRWSWRMIYDCRRLTKQS